MQRVQRHHKREVCNGAMPRSTLLRCRKEISKIHEMRGSRVHSPEVLAYFEHLRNERDKDSRKAHADKRKLEGEILNLQQRTRSLEAMLDQEKEVSSRIKASETEAQMRAERESVSRQALSKEKELKDKELSKFIADKEEEALVVAGKDDQMVQLKKDAEKEQERAQNLEDELKRERARADAEIARLREELGSGAPPPPGMGGAPPPMGSGAGDAAGARLPPDLPSAAMGPGGGVCGGLWLEPR